MPLEKRKL